MNGCATSSDTRALASLTCAVAINSDDHERSRRLIKYSSELLNAWGFLQQSKERRQSNWPPPLNKNIQLAPKLQNLSKNEKFGDPDDLLLHEFREAWAHYRHLELYRAKYISILFAIIAAGFGSILTLFKYFREEHEVWLYFELFVILWLMNILSIVR